MFEDGNQIRHVVRMVRERVPAPGKPVIVVRLRRQGELSGAAKVAVYAFLADQPFDEIYRGVVGMVHLPGTRRAEAPDRRPEIHHHARRAHAAVAAGGAGADRVLLEQSDVRAFPAERDCRGQPGQAAADDRDVDPAGNGAGRGGIECRRRVEPVGNRLHPCRLPGPLDSRFRASPAGPRDRSVRHSRKTASTVHSHG